MHVVYEAEDLNLSRQFEALMTLAQEYARNVPDELAEHSMAQINRSGRNIYSLGQAASTLAMPAITVYKHHHF